MVGSYPSAEVQSVYSTAPADWTSGGVEILSNLRKRYAENKFSW